MQYMGGKSRSGKRIADTIQKWRLPGQHFVDMCCGSLNVIRHVPGPRTAIDNCQPLIAMWKALQIGWVPPYVTEEMYYAIKAAPDMSAAITALALFGCSYGGVWSRSYAKPRKTQDYPACAVNQARVKSKACADVEFICLDYKSFSNNNNSIVYVDPPYKGVGGTYKQVSGVFDHADFWKRALSWGPYVFVSESDKAEPCDGWVLYEQWEVSRTMEARPTGVRGVQVERLYVPANSPMATSLLCSK